MLLGNIQLICQLAKFLFHPVRCPRVDSTRALLLVDAQVGICESGLHGFKEDEASVGSGRLDGCV